MEQTIRPGGKIDAATPGEIRTLLESIASHDEASRVRAAAVVVLDGAGSGQDQVYAVPLGYEFEARRVFLDLDTATDPSTGNVPLNVAGKAVEYRRSGSRIEYAAPMGPNAVAQVPGVQTWGAEQGPFLINGEVFEVKVTGLTPNSRLTAVVEGILHKRAPGQR